MAWGVATVQAVGWRVPAFNCLKRRWAPRQSRRLVLLLSSALLVSSAGAGERAGPIRIGALTESWGPTPSIVGLRDGLVERGYRDGQQFIMGVRFTQGDITALPAAARQLIQAGADIIVASGANASKAAQAATSRIPIVFADRVGDPVRMGLVQSFARPGANITGVTDLDLELAPKRLEIFREMIPGLKRVLLVYDATDAYGVVIADAYRDAARRLGIVLVEKAVRTEKEARATLANVRKGDIDGILGASTVSLNIPSFSLQAASLQAIPTMFNDIFWVERASALASYGPKMYESGWQAARLVDKILKGGDPARIPVEVNPKMDLAINLKVAETLGVVIPPGVLARADRLVQ
ncbi:MAG: ABC transporter substrate-binding protein [Anaerolineae bacterium]